MLLVYVAPKLEKAPQGVTDDLVLSTKWLDGVSFQAPYPRANDLQMLHFCFWA